MRRYGFACIAAGVVAAATSVAAAQDAPRPADEIINAIESVQMPQYDPSRREEEGYIQGFLGEREKAFRQQAALIYELYEAHPDNASLTEYLPRRWSLVARPLGNPQLVAEETAAYLKDHPEGPLVADAAFHNASAVGAVNGYDEAHFMPAVERFLDLAPGDERGARLLMIAAGESEGDQALALYRRVVKEFPNARATGYARGKVRQIEGVGKPFELSFTDAISGSTVSMKDLAGKVVVVDFWATWCGPCVAEMPHMKDLYAKWKDKGVQFVGVSLDQPEENKGLEKLRTFVKENDIQWPQYYQGAGWESEFSTSWGINSIPCMFVVDQKGTLHSVNGRGNLETIIPDLLGIEGPG